MQEKTVQEKMTAIKVKVAYAEGLYKGVVLSLPESISADFANLKLNKNNPTVEDVELALEVIEYQIEAFDFKLGIGNGKIALELAASQLGYALADLRKLERQQSGKSAGEDDESSL